MFCVVRRNKMSDQQRQQQLANLQDAAVIATLRQNQIHGEPCEVQGIASHRTYTPVAANHLFSTEILKYHARIDFVGNILDKDPFIHPISLFLAANAKHDHPQNKSMFGSVHEELGIHYGTPEQRVACVRLILNDITICIMAIVDRQSEEAFNYAAWYQRDGMMQSEDENRPEYPRYITEQACLAIRKAGITRIAPRVSYVLWEFGDD